MSNRIYQLPSFSLRFFPVWRRNFLVWRKLAIASVIGNIAEPLITLVAFGYGLGSLLSEINGVRYIEFLASGAISMSVMMAASFEALYSAFSRMHVQKTWESLLNTPLDLDDIVLAEMLWAASKAMISGMAILAVLFLLGIGLHPTTLLVPPMLFHDFCVWRLLPRQPITILATAVGSHSAARRGRSSCETIVAWSTACIGRAEYTYLNELLFFWFLFGHCTDSASLAEIVIYQVHGSSLTRFN
jgi:hypothetical protein